MHMVKISGGLGMKNLDWLNRGCSQSGAEGLL